MPADQYIQARPTVYKGIRMRSRLEASFAAELDRYPQLNWRYEPQCFANEQGQYLPDFEAWDRTHRAYFEVKPTEMAAEAVGARMSIIHDSDPDVWLISTHPVRTEYTSGTYWARDVETHPKTWKNSEESWREWFTKSGTGRIVKLSDPGTWFDRNGATHPREDRLAHVKLLDHFVPGYEDVDLWILPGTFEYDCEAAQRVIQSAKKMVAGLGHGLWVVGNRSWTFNPHMLWVDAEDSEWYFGQPWTAADLGDIP